MQAQVIREEHHRCSWRYWECFHRGVEWRGGMARARERGDLAGVAVLFVVGVALILLAPKESAGAA